MAFAPEKRLTLFTAAFLPILLALGSWQLDRAAQKRSVEDRLFDARAQLVRPTPAGAVGEQDHLSAVRLQGRFDAAHLVLVDNRTFGGRVGYEVFAPLAERGDGTAVLVGLGWVPAPPERSALPVVTLPAGLVSVTGLVDHRAGDVPTFGEDVETGWPLRVQRLDVERIATLLDRPLAPWPVMADRGEAGVQQHVFDPVRMPSTTHTGYAVQWFGLAAVLLAGWVIVGVRRGRAAPGVGAETEFETDVGTDIGTEIGKRIQDSGRS